MHVFALALVLAQHNIFDSIADNAHAKVGVSAWVIETNQRIGFRENERFDTESTYKLPICMAVLRKVSLAAKVDVRKQDMFPGQYSPLRDEYPNGHTFTVEELVRYTITLSDNTAADVLLRMAGG